MYLFCVPLFTSSFFFMAKQVHTQPAVTTTNSNTDIPSSAPSTIMLLLEPASVDSIWLCLVDSDTVTWWVMFILCVCEPCGLTVLHAGELHWHGGQVVIVWVLYKMILVRELIVFVTVWASLKFVEVGVIQWEVIVGVNANSAQNFLNMLSKCQSWLSSSQSVKEQVFNGTISYYSYCAFCAWAFNLWYTLICSKHCSWHALILQIIFRY